MTYTPSDFQCEQNSVTRFSERDSQSSDALWIARIRARDELALKEVMAAYTPTMLRLAAAITKSRDSAREVVQDVFVRLWAQGDSLTIAGDLQPYLWAATRNHARNLVRYEGVRHRTVESLKSLAIHVPRVANNTAIDTLEAEDILARLDALLSDLPPRSREIFLLHWRDGLSAESIAAGLGVGLRTVQNQIARALRHLATYWPQ